MVTVQNKLAASSSHRVRLLSVERVPFLPVGSCLALPALVQSQSKGDDEDDDHEHHGSDDEEQFWKTKDVKTT